MRKHLFFLCACFLLAQSSWAIDQSYYSTINNKSGSTLRDNLYTITCAGPTGMSYDGLWDAYKTSDVYPADSVGKAGKIWDMYSNVLWTPGQKQCGNYSNVGSCYNREHSVPKSWFNEKKPAYYDLGHIIPTDGYVNNQRGNNPIGECEGGTRLKNGSYVATGRSGSSTFSGYTSIGTVFEPDDQYKGDFARMYMYMAVRYKKGNKDDVSISSQMYNTTDANYGFTAYSVALLMKWHRMDPVSRKEIDRNNGMQSEQGNRNPFVDYPILAEYLWGTKTNETFSFDVATGSFEDDFIPGVSDGSNTNAARLTSPSGTIDCGATNTTDAVYKQITIQGENLENGNLTLAISGTNASFFSLATTTVTKAQAEAGYSVTLTYAPTADGNHTATLTITGCGITARTVQLTGKCTTVHTITWIDAENTQTTKVENNTSLVMPTNTPANCSADRVFVGWTATQNYSGDAAPSDMFLTSTKTITAPATFYAVYADAETTGGGSGSNGSVTITTSTENLPTSYGTAKEFTEYTFEGYKFMVQQMYLNGGKLQWRASGNSNGTGTMYNSEAFPGKLSSIVLTYNSSDANKNFTVVVGSSANPTEGTSITPTASGNVYTFDCSSANADYFVMTNGTGAGYLDQIEINYAGGSTTSYSNYSLECTATPKVTVTFHANNGTDATAVQQIPQNTTRALNDNTFTYADHIFLGWDTNSAAATVVYANGADITVGTANIDLYAVWEEIIIVTHTVTWKANGTVHATNTGIVDGTTVNLPTTDPDDCSETRVFMGWTAQSEFATEPTYLSGAQTITDDVTFYAVYADKETSGGGSGSSETVTLTMEDFAAVSGTSGDYSFATAKNNGSTEPTYNTGGKDLRIYAKGTLTVSCATAMTKIVFTISTQGLKRLAPIAASAGEIATQASGDATVTWTGSASEVVFTVGDKATYGTESDKAGQLCFTSMDITVGEGGGSTTTYSNYSPICSADPIVLPEYTVTFYNNGVEYATRSGHKGETMEAVEAPAVPCNKYTFKGWSSHQYAADNTDVPELDYTGVIPEGDAAYYAVFCHTEEGGSIIMTDDYKKITSTDELTDGNYLVVGEKEGLFAMSATFTGYYLNKADVVASGDVISSPADSIIWSIIVDPVNEQVTFNNAAAGYLYIEYERKNEKDYYNIKLGANTTDNKFTYAIDAETGGWVFKSATYTDRQLEYYSSKANWSFFTKQDAPVSLYQQQEGTTATVYYTTAPVCTPTAIDFIETEDAVARKVLINGHLYILKGNQMFNLQGARVR